MRTFDYQLADSVTDAVSRAAAPDAMYLAGGTNVVDLMRQGVYRPGVLVDISRLDLGDIEETADGGLLIGAAVRNSDLAADPRVRQQYPSLSQALLAGASGQIRNMATVAGNLLQRTRCGYFSDVTKPCNKRAPGSGCPAINGAHRDLAIIGHSPSCIATHPSDMAVALAALDARIHLSGPDGTRVLGIDEFHRLPGDDPTRDTHMTPGELITGVEMPPAADLPAASSYRKVRDRASFAFALISVAAGLTVTDGRVSAVRLAFGGVAPKPWRAFTAETALLGGPVTAAAFSAALATELQAAEPLADNAFKVELVSRTAVSVLLGLAGMGSEGDTQ